MATNRKNSILQINGYSFAEMRDDDQRLIYVTDAIRHGIFEVLFDYTNTPSLSYFDNTPDSERLTDDVQDEFLKYVMERYPHGFHTRDDKLAPWIFERMSYVYDMVSRVLPYGGLMVNNRYYDAYQASVRVDAPAIYENGELISTEVDVVIVSTGDSQFIIFWPYLDHKFFGTHDLEDLQVDRDWLADTIQIDGTAVAPGKSLTFSILNFDSEGRLSEETLGFRNDEGGWIETGLGNFVPAITYYH